MLVFLNPRAGLRETRRAGRRLAEALRAHGLDAEIVELRPGLRIGDVLAARDPSGCRSVVAAGGDGTLRSVAHVLADGPRPFGVIPLGTRNHFARDAGIPLSLEGAARVLRAGCVRRIDVGQVGDQTFLNNASLGLYPRFVAERRERVRIATRWRAIAGSAGAVLRQRRRLRIRIGDEAHEQRASIVFVGNNPYTLEGLDLGTRPRLDGGQLALVLASPDGWAGAARLALRALCGRLEPGRDYEARSASRLDIAIRRRRTLRVALDGEPTRMVPPLAFRSRPAALRLLVPEVT